MKSSGDRDKHLVDLKCGWLFPLPFLLLAAVVVVSGLVMLMQSPLIGIALILSGALVLSAHEGTEIDPAARTYREYNSFLWIKRGQKINYERVENIFVNAGRVSRRMYTAHTSQSSNFTDVEYKAWLKLSNGAKIFLLGGRNKGRLMKKLAAAAERLRTSVVDHTGGR